MFAWPETFNGSWESADTINISLRAPLPELPPLADKICAQLQESGVPQPVDIALQDSDTLDVNQDTQEFELDTVATLSCQSGSVTALNI
jgi:hypothetical protein